MEKNLNTIDLAFKEVNVKKSPYFKMVAILLMLIFAFNPLYELVDVFRKTFPHGWCCQPFDCILLTEYSYHFL